VTEDQTEDKIFAASQQCEVYVIDHYYMKAHFHHIRKKCML